MVFPAIAQITEGVAPESVVASAEASCFYHPANRAVVPCDECGRFLCHLCDLPVESRHLCPTCFHSGVSQRRIQGFETQRTMHDSIALALASFPPLLFWPVVISAPLTLFWVVRHWKSPRSIIPRTRIRFYLAAVFALTQIVLIGLVIVALMKVRR